MMWLLAYVLGIPLGALVTWHASIDTLDWRRPIAVAVASILWPCVAAIVLCGAFAAKHHWGRRL
jgi:hypothetical protein